MRSRVIALVLPLALLVAPQVASAQVDFLPTCTVVDVTTVVFDLPPICDGSFSIAPDPDAQQALVAAQARWDAIAKSIGRAATVRWLGPRPTKAVPIWWDQPVG